jgi:hypothetical protein
VQGNGFLQRFLGLQYHEEKGVPKDMVKSYAWYNLAVANGFEWAADYRDIVAEQMTPEQIAEAQALSAKWFELYQPKE